MLHFLMSNLLPKRYKPCIISFVTGLDVTVKYGALAQWERTTLAVLGSGVQVPYAPPVRKPG